MGPLSEEEREGLIPDYLTDKAAVYQLEQINIEDAIVWLRGKKLSADQIFSEDFILQLHRRMYGEVWKWAGTFRKSDRNLGVPFHLIPIELKKLIGDAKYWHEQKVYESIEVAIRFKHRLVFIHCFANGNGRHSRLMADLIVEKLYDLTHFAWGNSNLVADDEIRKEYIEALKQADAGEIDKLIDFVK